MNQCLISNVLFSQLAERVGLWLLLSFSLLISVGCVSFNPNPELESFRERAQTQMQGNVTVTTSVLNHAETTELFGLDLSLKLIQPVWVEIENNDDHPYWLVSTAMDPDYFSPHEVAYSQRIPFQRSYNDKIEKYFESVSFTNPILESETRSGFIFVNLDEDEKEIDIDLISKQETKFFDFYFELTGVRAASLKEVEAAHPKSLSQELSEEELRQTLRNMPCCTTSEDGTKNGDPLNLVIIGDSSELFPPFVRRGWHYAEDSYLGSIWKTINSFIFGKHYRYSPVSSLFYAGRKQDIALQKARGTIHQRNHLRLWLTDFTYNGKEIWIGQISRDIGVRFTLHTPTFTTHKIDTDIDEARTAFTEDMLFSQGVTKMGFVGGVGEKTPDSPGENLTGDIYYTDGLRVVLEFDRRPNNIENIEFFDWPLNPELGILPD